MTRPSTKHPAQLAGGWPWLAAAAVVQLPTQLLAQQEPGLPRPQEFVTTQEDSLFSLVRSQEDVHQWELALQERDRGEFTAAAERLHRLLQNEIGGTSAIGPNTFLGLRRAVELTIANLPAAGTEAYEELVKREAGSLYDVPATSLRTEQLQMLAERFPAASIGRRARLRLGDLALERGDGLDAAVHYELALPTVPIGSALARHVRDRADAADALLRSATLRQLPDQPPAVKDVLAVLPVSQDRTLWPAYGGGSDGRTPMQDPVGRPAAHWYDEITAPGFDDGRGSGCFSMQPVGGIDGLFLDTGLEVHAIDPLRGELQWTSLSPMREQTQARDMRDYPGSGSINQDMILAAAVGGDVVVAALQVPDETSLVRYQNAFTIVHRIPERRLFAFDRGTGKLLWSHFDRLEGPVTARFRGHSACGPPLILGDTVYAPVHDRSGAIAFYVGAYDLRTGQPRWRRLICSSQQEVNMFGNARMEFAASPLCTQGGLLLGCSNLGVCYAIERESGRVQWITAYDVIKMPPAMLQGQETRPVFFQNSAPIVADDVLCCTPLDSAGALGFDATTGAALWRLPYEAKDNGNNDVRWLCGVLDHEFVFAGRGVVAVPTRPHSLFGTTPPVRQVRSPEYLRSDDREAPRPAVSGQLIYYPTPTGISVFDAQGRPAPGAADMRLQSPGSLLLVDGIVVSVANRMVEVLLDADALRTRADEQLRRTPDDPTAILRAATLTAAREGGSRDALEQLYRRGVAACERQGLPTDHPLHAAFLRRLFDFACDRADRTAGDDGIRLLIAARDYAPDLAAFLRVQSSILERCSADPVALQRELDLLLARAGGASHALPDAGGTVPVATYVAWRKTLLLDDPRQQIAAWQRLLLEHPDDIIQHQLLGDMAQRMIVQLIAAHGRGIYSELEARAAALLADAGDNPEALRAVARSYPHSEAATKARARLLDRAVAAGDLGTAVDLLAIAVREGSETPSLLRRVLEAARIRGNLALAAAVAERLQNAADASDWPADAGQTFAAATAALLPALTAAPEAVVRAVPSTILDQVELPMPRLLPVSIEPGFQNPPDAICYLALDDQLRALDLRDPARPVLFQYKSGVVDQLWVCGRALIVPGLDRIVAIDAQNGSELWEVTAPGKLLTCHGLIRGVLAITQREGADDIVLLGVEPLSGHTLFTRQLPAATQAPKPTATDLMIVRPNGTDAVIDRIDPVTGRTAAGFVLGVDVATAAHAAPETLQSAQLLQRFDASTDLLFVPIDSSLSNGPPRVLAVGAAGTVAWTWEGVRGSHLLMTARRGERICVVESSRPGGGRAVVLAAASGATIREVPLGSDARVLNWQRQRSCAPAPEALLLTDLDDRSGDRRLVVVPIDDSMPSFAVSLASTEQVARSPSISAQLLVFGVDSRSQGPLRLMAVRPTDRASALPDGRNHLLLPVPPRTQHEIGVVGPYTVMTTDSRLFVLGDGKDTR